ncbi:MAG TPA: formyltransferase family protein [Allosphingosinicella sp.]|nr:formyltransferase family protein [Allosphingosinicella sp.]
MKFAYFGYDLFSNVLDALVDDGHELAELFTPIMGGEYNTNRDVCFAAARRGARITLSKARTEDFERLKRAGVELIVAAAYPGKIPEWRDSVRYAVNVHPSLLPAGRGVWPMPWAILRGESRTGVTIHEISERFDAGDIIAQTEVEIGPRDNLTTLSVRLQLEAARLIRPTIRDIETLWASKRPQAGGRYSPMPKDEDRTMRLDMTVAEIDRIYRAFHRFEPYIYLDGVRHVVKGLDCWQERHDLAAGTCVRRTPRESTWAVADGFLCLSELVKAEEF